MPKLIFKPIMEAETDFTDVKRFYGDEVVMADESIRPDIAAVFGGAYIILVNDPVDPERIAFSDELFVEA